MRQLIIVFLLLMGIHTTIMADVLASILQQKILKVCIWPEYYGISYVDPRTQELKGIDVDLAYALGQDLGVKISFIESSFATLISDIETKRCDIAMFAIGRTPKRMEKLSLTTPHLASDIYAIAAKSNHRIQQWEDIDKPNVVVAVAKGTYHVDVMKQKLKYAKLLIVDSFHAREQEVESGRADVFMTDYPFGVRMITEKEWAKLIKPSKPFHTTFYGWAVSQNEESFLARIESFITTIKHDGRLLKAAQKNHLEAIVLSE
ncbi:MAG: ABC transporter substrate-binding protein [Sulfurospirillaceae bacterium]|nr:ABC transporter substrate-binding protein [Sulfurospirillaceae bacterium]MDD2826581.1 ABC transporter substrate-binding protein [Sulfurospirillaceae bacterium]